MIPASVRRRVYRRAAIAWVAGKPHKAWEILAEAGLADHWPTFQRVAVRQARNRYRARMVRYTA